MDNDNTDERTDSGLGGGMVTSGDGPGMGGTGSSNDPVSRGFGGTLGSDDPEMTDLDMSGVPGNTDNTIRHDDDTTTNDDMTGSAAGEVSDSGKAEAASDDGQGQP